MTPPEARNQILEIMTRWFDARSRGDTVADVAQDLANLDGEIENVVHELVVSERERAAQIAKGMAIPGHSVQAPSCLEIARKICES